MPPPSPPFLGLRSNGTRVLLPSGQPFTGVGVNVVDDYK